MLERHAAGGGGGGGALGADGDVTRGEGGGLRHGEVRGGAVDDVLGTGNLDLAAGHLRGGRRRVHERRGVGGGRVHVVCLGGGGGVALRSGAAGLRVRGGAGDGRVRVGGGGLRGGGAGVRDGAGGRGVGADLDGRVVVAQDGVRRVGDDVEARRDDGGEAGRQRHCGGWCFSGVCVCVGWVCVHVW